MHFYTNNNEGVAAVSPLRHTMSIIIPHVRVAPPVLRVVFQIKPSLSTNLDPLLHRDSNEVSPCQAFCCCRAQVLPYSKKSAGDSKGGSGGLRKQLVIMDEVDGMGGSDRGGIQELISLIKKTKVPIIAICNDRQHPKIRYDRYSCFTDCIISKTQFRPVAPI